MTTIERTLREFRQYNVMCDVAQRWISFQHAGGGGVRKDLFGIIDVVALLPGSLVGIQCCQEGDFAQHWRLLTEERADTSRRWLAAGGALLIHKWHKMKLKRGGEREVWNLQAVNVTLEDLKGDTNGPKTA